MIKAIREQFWYIKGFVKKYLKQILLSLVVTLSLAILGNFLISKLPKVRPNYRIGLIGQFTSGQLPPIITDFLNSGLTYIDDQLQPQPNLAERWTVDDDGNTYTLYLRDGLKWQTGEDLKPSDIKLSIPNVNIEATDPNIIRFKIPTKFSPFPSLLNFPLVNQKGKTVGEYDIKLKQKSTGIITQIVLESTKNKITFEVYSTPKLAVTAFKLGQLDLVYNLPSDISGDVEQFGKISKHTSTGQVVMLVFNQSDPSLKDKNTRQAIAYALKDKSFGEESAITTINPKSWAYNPLVKTYPFNPARSRELMTAPVSLELSTTPELLPIAENIRTQLESDKIKISTKVVTAIPDQFQLLLTTYTIPVDPDQYRDWHSTQATNIGKNNDEKIDKLLEDGRIIFDKTERKSIYFDFQKTFAEELPALVLYHPSYFDLSRKQAYFDIINPIR